LNVLASRGSSSSVITGGETPACSWWALACSAEWSIISETITTGARALSTVTSNRSAATCRSVNETSRTMLSRTRLPDGVSQMRWRS
jgi:hypothetical protein